MDRLVIIVVGALSSRRVPVSAKAQPYPVQIDISDDPGGDALYDPDCSWVHPEELTMKGVLAALSLLLLPSLAGPLWAQAGTPTPTATMPCTIRTAYPVRFDFMQTPLRNITPTPQASLPPAATPTPAPPGGGGSGAGFGTDPVVQAAPGPALDITLGPTFEGVGEGFGGFDAFGRPDANGDVGAYQYVQWVNNAFAIFDKASGEPVYGPAPGGTLFRGFGGPCEESSKGDPIVLYDQLAHRWILTVLASTGGFSANQCIGVSETEDATGRYYRYEYQTPGVPFPDYPKIGLWPDGYYYSADPLGGRGLACALDREAILDSTPTLVTQPLLQCCLLPQNGANFRLLPSDLDGDALPPVGTQNPFVNLNRVTKALQLWKFQADFANPANSKFLGPYPITGLAPFEGFACNADDLLRPCVPQLGTDQELWALGNHVMHRLAYRQFGQHASLVVNHSVHLNAGTPSERIGVRWYEIRIPDGMPSIFQQGTFAPDSKYRWMGSTATDREGSIAAGYSLSSSTSHPSIAVTGRAWNDPTPGIMRSELIAVAGNGSQTSATADVRDWGDYTSMSVDPVFDCDFWYTNQYLAADGFNNWKTHVFSFRFPNCTECVGDCNRDDEVETGAPTVDELVKAIDILLGNQPIINCLRSDGNGDGKVTCDEIVTIVNYALNGCPQPPTAGSGGAAGGGSGAIAELELWSDSGYRGEPVSFPLVLAEGHGEVSAINFDLLYPANVITTPNCWLNSSSVPAGHSLSHSDPTPGRRRFLIADLETFPGPIMSDGIVLVCNATILSNAPYGSHTMPAEDYAVSDSLGNPMPATMLQNGRINVFQPSGGGGGGGCSTISTRGGLPIELVLVLLPWLNQVRRRLRARVATGVPIAILVLLVSIGPSSAQSGFSKGGNWSRTDRSDSVGTQRSWHVSDVVWTGKRTISGRLALAGSSFMGLGRFEAEVVDSKRVQGVVTNIDGKQIGILEADLTDTGLVGRFVGDNGEVGEWTWSTPEPERLEALFELATEE